MGKKHNRTAGPKALFREARALAASERLCTRCDRTVGVSATRKGPRQLPHNCPHGLPCQKIPGEKSEIPTCPQCEKQKAARDRIGDSVARLTRVFPFGGRVVAAVTIFYADAGITIKEGTHGTTLQQHRRRLTGLSLVHWDGVAGAYDTGNDAIDPVSPDVSCGHEGCEVGREKGGAR
jgi:hypothetical protein